MAMRQEGWLESSCPSGSLSEYQLLENSGAVLLLMCLGCGAFWKHLAGHRANHRCWTEWASALLCSGKTRTYLNEERFELVEVLKNIGRKGI